MGCARRRTLRFASVELHTPRVEVSDLKLGILQQLLAHPMLAREFNQDVIDEHLHGEDRIDREIAEVWRASTATTASEAAVLSHGALLEMLAESEYADQYRAIAAQEMEIETGVEVARQIVSEAFAKLKLRRFERDRAERLADYERDPSPQRLDAYRAADQAYTRAREPAEPQVAAMSRESAQALGPD